MRRSRVWLVGALALAWSLTIPGAALAQDTSWADDFDYTNNMQPYGAARHPLPAPGVFNSDLAFWGDMAVHGTYDGFNLVDISDPANPSIIHEFDSCVQGTTQGNQGDIVIWDDILVRALNSPAPTGGLVCGGVSVPQGQEGIVVFDISDRTDPVGLKFVPAPCGTHTLTGVPDLDNDRLIIYGNPSGGACPNIDIMQVPLGAPQNASYLSLLPVGGPCHDTGVILGKAMRMACAGGNGFTIWSLDPRDGASFTNPVHVRRVSLPGVTIGHSASWTWDGKVLIFGHEPGGGGQAQCQATSSVVNRTLYFFDEHGDPLGEFLHPRPQTATENCTWHNYNVVPSNRGYLLVSGNYQSGISVIDFTDPANAVEVAYADPEPLSDTQLMIGGDWSTYWYNGTIYEGDITRGLLTWKLRGNHIARAARRLTHLNPQTQEFTFPVRSALSD